MPRSGRRRPRRKIGSQCGVVEAVARDGLRRVDPAFEASMGVRDNGPNQEVLGPELEPIRLNYCWFFLVFSLADDVVDPIKEGEGGE